jgi:small subunit ribosomal protein S6
MVDKRNYETTFVVTPDLSAEDYTAIVQKFNNLLKDQNAEVVNQEVWGFRKLAYPINKKMTGYYVFTEFSAPVTIIPKLELEYEYDERIIRYLTIKLEKDALEYSSKRRARLRGELPSR